jgi:hypothetical protein
MKTIISISFLVGSLLSSLMTFATGNFTVNLSPTNENKAVLEINTNVARTFDVSIRNNSGELIQSFTTEETSDDFNKTIDFSNLRYGTYQLSVEVEGSSSEQLISIGKNGIEVLNETRVTAPYFTMKNDLLVLSFLNHQSDDATLYIYEGSSLVYQHEIGNSFVTHKGFDVSGLDNADYMVVLASGDNYYRYEMTRD